MAATATNRERSIRMTVSAKERGGLAADETKVYTEPRHTEPRRKTAGDFDERLDERLRRGEPVFKKTEETEWTRFSRALPSRPRDEAEEAADEDTVTATPAASSPASVRPGTQDVNMTVARPAPRPATMPGSDDVESIIGERTTVDGVFKSESSIRVKGTVQGEIESRNEILIEESASVSAKVTATTITVAGQVDGQIFCNGRLEIRPTGRVTGEINAGTLVMQEGAFFEGQLHMGRSAAAPKAGEPKAGEAKPTETAAAH